MNAGRSPAVTGQSPVARGTSSLPARGTFGPSLFPARFPWPPFIAGAKRRLPEGPPVPLRSATLPPRPILLVHFVRSSAVGCILPPRYRGRWRASRLAADRRASARGASEPSERVGWGGRGAVRGGVGSVVVGTAGAVRGPAS